MNESALKTWGEKIRASAWGTSPRSWREIVSERSKEDFLLGMSLSPDGRLDSTDPLGLPQHMVDPVLTLFRNAFEKLIQIPEFTSNLRAEFPVVICLHDSGRAVPELKAPLFVFNRMKQDADLFLVPDPINIWILNDGKNYQIIDGQRESCLWENRKECLFWRGSSTGSPPITEKTWRDNPRVKLAMLARDFGDRSILDIGLSEVVQYSVESDIEIVKSAGIVLPAVKQIEFMDYKYLLDIDGNANAWGLLQKFYFGSTIFKIPSCYEQWFYSELKPWVNYIPVEATTESLVGAVRFARENDANMRSIADAGLEMARKIDYASLVDFTVDSLLKISRLAPTGAT